MVSNAYKRYKAAGLCRRCGKRPLPGKTRCKNCHADHLAYTKKAKDEAMASGLCRYCCVVPRLPNRSMCSKCCELHATKQKRNYDLWRNACIKAYGGRCVCCGLSNNKYLQLDHKENDGAEHKRKIFGHCRGRNMYRWAYKNNFPDLLQLLCANCHQAKTFHGECTTADHAEFNGLKK